MVERALPARRSTSIARERAVCVASSSGVVAGIGRSVGNRAFAQAVLQRFQGDPAHTRDELLRRVWERYETARFADTEAIRVEVEDAIYDMATKGSESRFTKEPPSAADHIYALKGIPPETARGHRIQWIAWKTWMSYERVHRPDRPAGSRSRRVAVHVHPDHIYKMVLHLCRNLLALDAVGSFKVSILPESVAARLDNVDIYFYDGPGEDNVSGIRDVLMEASSLIVPHHPAMMTPLVEGLGIGTGDEPRGEESFNGLRSKIIRDAVLVHVTSKRFKDFVAFCACVADLFGRAGIDPNNPSRNLSRR